jgi:rSAM/selenodomain-associated transferase 1
MRTLCIMAKAPMMGLVKTRLARQIGSAAAVTAYRTMLLQSLRRLGRDRRWRIVLAIAPDMLAASPALPPGFTRVGQGTGDLGARMQRVVSVLRTHGPVLVIGSDIPGVAPWHVARAFRALEAHDAVLGPAPDGGYWAIGFGRRRALTPFAQVRWSTPHARADTLANLKHARVALVDELSDIDTADEWRIWSRQPPSTRFRGD